MMDVRPIRLGLAPHAALTAGAGVEHRLQHPVAQRCRQRPAQRRRRKTVEGHRHCAARNPQRSGDRPVRRAAFMLETQDLAYPSHRHSLGWHRLPHSSWPRRAQEPSRPAVERSPPLPGVAELQIGMAEFKSESGADFIPRISGRLAPESAALMEGRDAPEISYCNVCGRSDIVAYACKSRDNRDSVPRYRRFQPNNVLHTRFGKSGCCIMRPWGKR